MSSAASVTGALRISFIPFPVLPRIDHQSSGRYMEVSSTNPTVFAYSNHFVETILEDKVCKDGVVYKQYCAIEMMPMGYPNAINMVYTSLVFRIYTNPKPLPLWSNSADDNLTKFFLIFSRK